MAYEYRVSVDVCGKTYIVPIKWISSWVEHNTDYESFNLYLKKSNDKSKKEMIKTAKKEGVLKNE